MSSAIRNLRTEGKASAIGAPGSAGTMTRLREGVVANQRRNSGYH